MVDPNISAEEDGWRQCFDLACPLHLLGFHQWEKGVPPFGAGLQRDLPPCHSAYVRNGHGLIALDWYYKWYFDVFLYTSVGLSNLKPCGARSLSFGKHSLLHLQPWPDWPGNLDGSNSSGTLTQDDSNTITMLPPSTQVAMPSPSTQEVFANLALVFLN